MPINHDNILIELNKAVKTLHFYPTGHPNLEGTLTHCHALFFEAASESGGLKWTIDKKGIYADNNPVAPTNPATPMLARDLFLRRIHELNFTADMTTEDLRRFIMTLALEPEEIFAKGGIERILVAKRIKGILLNEMTYDEMAKLEDEVEEEIEEIEEEESEDFIEEDDPNAEAKALMSLLREIENERDSIIYNDLAIRIVEAAEPLLLNEDYDHVFPAIYLMCWHSLPASNLPQELTYRAGEVLPLLLKSGAINYLIKRLTNKSETKRGAIEQMLLRGGDDAVDFLLNFLIDTEEAQARRAVFNMLVQFGDKIRERVQLRLNDPRWFVARQMVSLLGELGSQDSITALHDTYYHEDVRVKKEVLKSLSRIPSTLATETITEALQEEDRVLRGQAIISLGILKDKSALPALGKLALKDDKELRKEALKAIAMIGGEETVPYLSKVVLKKSWFSKDTNDDIRELAVLSLAKIGGEIAFNTIEKASRNSSGRLYATCIRALEGAKQS
ncbi:MAG: HEAT repeat domain-containing protein [Deltaproteobacteria bacterium]|nr:HEAT repeat domain-containing protein [Deltaproteobacteria bacterium]